MAKKKASAKKSDEAPKLAEGEVKVELKLKRRHPHKQMRLGRHVVKVQYQEFELNEAEQAELKSKGGKHWFCTPEEEKAARALKKKVRQKED